MHCNTIIVHCLYLKKKTENKTERAYRTAFKSGKEIVSLLHLLSKESLNHMHNFSIKN